MHEMSVAQNILDIVREKIDHKDDYKVKNIRLRMGELAGVFPDSLLFCFNVLKDGAAFPNATLNIEHIPVTARCNNCNKISRLEYGVFICPLCTGSSLVLLTGNELNVIEIELDD